MAEVAIEMRAIEEGFGKLDVNGTPPSKSRPFDEKVLPVDGTVEEFTEDQFYGTTRIKDEDVSSEDVLVNMKNVHKTYLLGIEGVPALRGVSMQIRRGEFVCIFGTSGGGKTTMLNIMGTIDKPTKGEINLCGTRVTEKTKDSELSLLRLQRIGFVFQTFNLLSSLSALENVEMPMILSGKLSPAERRSRAKELLGLVGMTPRLDHVPSMLSGGEQQRVTIARSIANSPELLLLDEPTGDLDTANTLHVMKLLTELNRKERITMVMVTHDVGLRSYADRIIWMRDGKIQRIETVAPSRKKEQLDRLDRELADLEERQRLKAAQAERPLQTEVRRPTDYHTHPKNIRHAVAQAAAARSSKAEVHVANGGTHPAPLPGSLVENGTYGDQSLI